MTYIEELNQLKTDNYLFNDDASWYVSDRTCTCYCGDGRPCYHYKIYSKIYEPKCSFLDRFKPEQCIRFSNAERKLFSTI